MTNSHPSKQMNMYDDSKLKIYDRLTLPKSLKIPSRSRLYSLEPIGTGTPFAESLSSYLTRLAQEHCLPLKKLIMGEIASIIMGDGYQPEMLSKNASLLFPNSDAKPAINGMRDMTRSLVDALEQLTLCQDLRYLSLTYKEVIKERGLFRQHKAWCPQCFEQWRQENKTLYEPLIWSFKDVNYCSQHHCQLVDRCPYCDSQLKAISDRSIIVFCDRCKKWLGSESKFITNSLESNLLNTREIENSIAVIYSLNYQLTLPDVMRKLQLIHFYFEKAINQDLTQLIALGKTMEQSKITFTSHYDKPLSLVKLLIPVCETAKISISQFFNEDLSALSQILALNFNTDCMVLPNSQIINPQGI